MPPKTYLTIEEINQSSLSPYRKNDAREWIERGFEGFRLVSKVTRNSARPDWELSPEQKKEYIIECRGATSGRWGKIVVYRMVPKTN